MKAFGAPLDKINLIEIKQLIDYNCVDGLCHDCITESGFVYLNSLLIQRERIETTGTILRSFGYADDLSLRSDLVQAQFTLQSGCLVELSSVGIQFLTSLFHKHDKDHDGALSPQEFVDLFEVCPPLSNPWGMDVLHSVTTNSKGWIDLAGFLCQWNMTAYLDTPRFLEYLAYFGYMQSDQYPIFHDAHHRFNLRHSLSLQPLTSSNRTGKGWPWECPFKKRGTVAKDPRSLRT